MSSPISSILEDIREALTAAEVFSAVHIGATPADTSVPRAAVLLQGTESIRPAGDPTTRYLRLRIRILIATRSDDAAEGTTRLADLAALAASAILADPGRNGACHDLPIGPATDVTATTLPPTAEHPERQSRLAPSSPTHEAVLDVHCHVHTDDLIAYPATTLDGVDLFDSGIHELCVGPWETTRKRRSFPGLDGELVLTFGRRGRTITQTGRLQATTTDALLLLISDIEACDDAALHVLVDAHGREFSPVTVDSFELTSPIEQTRVASCSYTIRYRQSS